MLGVYTHGKVQNPSSAFALKMEPDGHCYHIVKTVRRQGFYKIWINFGGKQSVLNIGLLYHPECHFICFFWASWDSLLHVMYLCCFLTGCVPFFSVWYESWPLLVSWAWDTFSEAVLRFLVFLELLFQWLIGNTGSFSLNWQVDPPMPLTSSGEPGVWIHLPLKKPESWMWSSVQLWHAWTRLWHHLYPRCYSF